MASLPFVSPNSEFFLTDALFRKEKSYSNYSIRLASISSKSLGKNIIIVLLMFVPRYSAKNIFRFENRLIIFNPFESVTRCYQSENNRSAQRKICLPNSPKNVL